MRTAVIKMSDLLPFEINDIITDVDSVTRYNREFQSAFNSFVFLHDGCAYGCDYGEPCSFDRLYRVK